MSLRYLYYTQVLYKSILSILHFIFLNLICWHIYREQIILIMEKKHRKTCLLLIRLVK